MQKKSHVGKQMRIEVAWFSLVANVHLIFAIRCLWSLWGILASLCTVGHFEGQECAEERGRINIVKRARGYRAPGKQEKIMKTTVSYIWTQNRAIIRVLVLQIFNGRPSKRSFLCSAGDLWWTGMTAVCVQKSIAGKDNYLNGAIF